MALAGLAAAAWLPQRAVAQTLNFEAESLKYVGTGASTSVQTDTKSSGGKWVELEANSVGDTIDFTIPSIPAGTYQISMMWKGNDNRGILNLKVDGTQLGGTLDQYSASESYPMNAFGTTTFSSAGAHTIRLTTTGKNGKSSGMNLSADRFTFITQGSVSPAATPTFNPPAGSYSTPQSVTIASATPGAVIHYTTDGSLPTSSHGTVYSTPVSISTNTTLQAIASAAGFSDSSVATGNYVIPGGGGQVATPTFSPPPGSYVNSVTVSISDATPGAVIYYTVDGSPPTPGVSNKYTSPIGIFATTTLQAIATAPSMTSSAIASGNYVITSGGGKPNGNPILPPKWAFGVMFGCYDNQANVLSDMNQLRSGHLGGDLIWVDSSWLSSNYGGPGSAYMDYKFDSAQFPDPAGMISQLHTNNFYFGVWEWPWIDSTNTTLFPKVANAHGFIENSSGSIIYVKGWHGNNHSGQLDLSTDANEALFESLNQPMFDIGFDFLKMDTTVGIPGGGKLADGSTSSTDWKGFYHRAAWLATSKAKLAQGRGFLLAHSDAGAATNNDQYPGLWTGDSSASFSSMVSKDMGGGFKCNTKTSGAYWCGDTGGYNSDSNDELYQRWLEYGCFTPLTEFFGAKGTKGPTGKLGRFPWCFNAPAQATYLKYTQLRYRLLPFRYSNAQACYHITGGAVQYPVWWPNNKQIINGHGDSQILVQPVTTAGASSASVALPSGSDWIDYNSGAVHAGGSTVTVSAPVNVVPMFIKAGSIIPMGPVMEYVDQLPADPLTLDIYPAGATGYTLYEDDGISDLYISGEFSTTQFTSNNTSGHEVVTIGAAVGSFAGQLSGRTYVLKVNQQASAPASVTRDGTTETQLSSQSAFDAASEGWFYDATAHIVWVKFHLSTSSATSVTL